MVLLVNGDSVNPLYYQVKQHILDDINQEKYAQGQQLPTEAELCEMYGVSRITIRRAVSDLVAEGVLFRHQGKGTFVTGVKMKEELLSVNGFTEFSLVTGRKFRSRVLSTSTVHADSQQAGRLRVKPGDSLIRLERLLYFNEVPLMMETLHYSCDRFPHFDAYIGESTSTYDILKRRYGVEPTSTEKVINVVFAQKPEAEYLRVPIGETLFEINETMYDQHDLPMHTSLLHVPANKVTLTVQRVHKNQIHE